MKIFISLLILSACSSGEIESLRSASNILLDQNSESKDKDSTKKTEVKDPATFELTAELKKEFEDNVAAKIDSNCASCHGDPREVSSSTPGPRTILDPQKAAILSLDGESVAKNKFSDKINGNTAHTGPAPCSSGFDSSDLCSSLVTWFTNVREEFAPGSEATAEDDKAGYGIISSVSWKGTISGYAYKASTPDVSVDVEIFINDVSITKISADKVGFVNGVMGDHKFLHKLDSTDFEPGLMNKVSVFAIINGEPKELSNSPQNVIIYAPKAKDVFDSEVSPKLSSCASAGCHQGAALWTYDLAIDRLATKPSSEGGTSESNLFYTKASGNGGHAGGNRCASVTGLCDSIKAWWTAEFE